MQRLDPADIPVVILAGGMGMRLREETERVPKPMVPIGPKPIIWHIMKHYSTYGFRRFMICLGYKSWVIKEYFLNYQHEMHDLRVDLAHPERGVAILDEPDVDDWEITLVETGLHSGSTGRVLGVSRYIDTPYFMYTYGDGVGDVDLDALHRQHVGSDRLVTITGVHPSSRYGVLQTEGDRVVAFDEKPESADGYVSGGFFCMNLDIIHRFDLSRSEGFLEIDVLPTLTDEDQVGLHHHHGWWHSMDTYRDFVHLNDLWRSGEAPWKTW